MGKFAKLFELENDEQVLVSVTYDSNEDLYECCVRTDVDGVYLSITLAIYTEQESKEWLQSFTTEQAVAFRESAVSSFIDLI